MSTTETSPENKKLNLEPTLPDLPDDVIFIGILPKVPAKSLVRFKCVDHSWNTFISSVELAETISCLSSRSVLTLESDLRYFVALDYDDGDNVVTRQFGKGFKRLDALCSSSNGLVFLISCSNETDDNVFRSLYVIHRFNFTYVVHNPVLGVDHFVEIPDLPEHPLSDDVFKYNLNYSFGFGYVSSLDDYFIIAIDFPPGFAMNLYVYSLRLHEWTIRPGTIDQLGDNKTLRLRFQDPWFLHTGTLVNETLYWGMAHGADNQFILAFGLEMQDDYELIDLPYANFGETRFSRCYSAFSLCCLDGSLCAWASYHTNEYEMWMFEENEESELGYSWVFLFSFTPDYVVRNFFGCNKSGQILVYKQNGLNGELILANFLVHPPELSQVVLDDSTGTVDYEPSLVSVPNMAAVQRE